MTIEGKNLKKPFSIVTTAEDLGHSSRSNTEEIRQQKT
jgi:hypothetical protein